MSLTARFINSVEAVPAEQWNRLTGDEYPFHRHEFLAALENSGCINGQKETQTGWYPFHLLLEDESGTLVGLMPLYQKTNSEGEFVFDFAWANAYHQAGLDYFPKLVAAVPFTPATSQCCFVAPDQNSDDIRATLINAAIQVAGENSISSLHLLFPTETEQTTFTGLGLLSRHDCQYHWHNKDYSDFSHFLGEFSSKKRKNVKRERRKVAEAGISFKVLTGHEMTDALWDEISPLYASTFWRRGRAPYLNPEFFKEISSTLPDSLVVVIGEKDGAAVSTAICFRGKETLYGRYWGCADLYDSLHFETCYYQGIDYCIKEGIKTFEPGTQGEHKIARGFTPTTTWSSHWIADQRFASAIADYLEREGEHIDDYAAALESRVPFRKDL